MNSNFNRQFILIDFKLLEDKKFLDFLGSSEFGTYLVLRRHVWRSPEQHYMGLHDLYSNDQLLTCSLERSKISEVTGIDPDNISRHLTSLAKKGVIKRRRTGRQNIYVLGEWVDVHGDGSYKLEWFYLEGKYGISKTDLTESVRSDLTLKSDQNQPKASDNNIETNKKENTVNGSIKKLKNLKQPEDKTDYVAQRILDQLGDDHSKKFYKLVAAKVPEDIIFRALAEIKTDGAKSPAKVFTHRMKLYAIEQMKKEIGSRLSG
ncbi:MAG TPA: winged helix-turn-helix domain-containing protein [Candidatus Bathyarchaeia archaeon]|nr:winged helix-turn-helix domain-containing protein [Candidatus Bathyarchaeia archaeon]